MHSGHYMNLNERWQEPEGIKLVGIWIYELIRRYDMEFLAIIIGYFAILGLSGLFFIFLH